VKKLPWAVVSLMVAAACGSLLFAGCGSDPVPVDPDADASAEQDGEADGGAIVPPVDCNPTGQQCGDSRECCSGNCEIPDGGASGVCAKALGGDGICLDPGEACTTGIDCCTRACVGGTCWDKQCVPDSPTRGDCTQNEECCSGTCGDDKKCVPLPTECGRTEGNPCDAPADCCSKQCNNGICANGSFCTQTGDICAADTECCGGVCTKAAGATYGACGVVAGGAGASSCNPNGTVCGAGGGESACDNSCCSRACGPWGTTGTRVCQPASGCKPTHEMCTASGECCGSPPNPSGTGFQTTCAIADGASYGRCTRQNQCDPPGAICKIASEACGVQNRCCDPAGAPSNYCQSNPDNCCKKDALGIPRCIVAIVDCEAGAVPDGTACATSADCCGKPCVDNKCGVACVPKDGACTSNSDCCSGLPCTDGKCADKDPTNNCTLYGQACTQAGECCSGVPCTGGTCRYP
jgi:hypothetical protein